jgi:MFS family permease
VKRLHRLSSNRSPGRWEWIFFINIPIGALVIALAPVFLPESRAESAERRLDVTGAASITGGLVLLVYALTRAAETSWTATETIVLHARGGRAARSLGSATRRSRPAPTRGNES